LYKGKILKKIDASLFNMPSLEGDRIAERDGLVKQSAGEIQRKAYEEGFASGEKAGFEAGEQKVLVLIDQLEKVIEEVTIFKGSFVKEVEAQVVDLAVAIARKIIVEEINAKPEIIITMVIEALKRLQRIGTITIKINPALYDLFMNKKPELIDVHKDIIFDVNSKVPLTGPIVISRTEEVITDIESLLSNIGEEMEMKSRTHSKDDISVQGNSDEGPRQKSIEQPSSKPEDEGTKAED
jgi:hypothetical protein